MGLNESFAQVRGHILLQEPLPIHPKVFSFLLQEERQRMISNRFPSLDSSSVGDVNSSVTTLAVSKPRGSRPMCTHCNRLGLLVDKCYKIHGYPSGSKPRPQSTGRDTFAKDPSSSNRQLTNDQ